MQKAAPYNNASIWWFNVRNQTQVKGIAIVIHGLNLNPDRMGSIISCLTKSGIDVLNLTLHGHGDNYSPNKNLIIDKASVGNGLWDKMMNSMINHLLT